MGAWGGALIALVRSSPGLPRPCLAFKIAFQGRPNRFWPFGGVLGACASLGVILGLTARVEIGGDGMTELRGWDHMVFG